MMRLITCFDTIAGQLPDTWGSLRNLLDLKLDINQLTGMVLDEKLTHDTVIVFKG